MEAISSCCALAASTFTFTFSNMALDFKIHHFPALAASTCASLISSCCALAASTFKEILQFSNLNLDFQSLRRDFQKFHFLKLECTGFPQKKTNVTSQKEKRNLPPDYISENISIWLGNFFGLLWPSLQMLQCGCNFPNLLQFGLDLCDLCDLW